MHVFEVALPSVHTRDHFIEITVDLQSKLGQAESFLRQIHFDRLRFTAEGFFVFELDSARLVLGLQLDNPEVKIPKGITVNDFASDLQHRGRIFPEDLADHLKLSRQTPYLVELVHNTLLVEKDSKELILKLVLEQIFRTDSHAKGVRGHFDRFIKDLNASDLLKQSRSASPDKASIFEPLLRVAVFSPLPPQETIAVLFRLLGLLDLTPSFLKVKLTHVEFLIWYLMRLALNHLPFAEVSTAVRGILFGEENHVVSATIACLEGSTRPSLPVTDLFRLWFIAAQRRGVSHIELGKGGFLKNLKEALDFWIGEHTGKDFALGRLNELRVVLSVRGELVKWDIRFDDQMRLVLPFGDPEMQLEGSHIIAMEDSEYLMDLGEFKKIMEQFPAVSDILNRTFHLGTATWNLDVSLGKKEDEFDDDRLAIKCTYQLTNASQPEEVTLGYAEFVPGTSSEHVEEPEVIKIDHLLCEPNKFFFSKTLVPSVAVKTAHPQKQTLKELVLLSLRQLKADLIEHGRHLTYGSGYKYRLACLELAKVKVDDVKVLITHKNERKLAKKLEIPAEEVWSHFKSDRGGSSSAPQSGRAKILDLEILIDQKHLKNVCCYLTRDYYSLGGVSLATDRLVPCQMNSRNDHFGDVLYENTGSLRLPDKMSIALEDIILQTEPI